MQDLALGLVRHIILGLSFWKACVCDPVSFQDPNHCSDPIKSILAHPRDWFLEIEAADEK